MRKLIVSEWVTLDGVFDATNMNKWFAPYDSSERREHIMNVVVGCDAIVLGRTSYEMLGPHWSKQTNDDQGPAHKLNSVAKYVVSSTLAKADWNNSTIIKKNVEEEITKVKQQPGHYALIMGSATLVQSLMATDLIDEYQFLVHPVVMGSGTRFFKDGMNLTKLTLLETKTIGQGVTLLRYQPTRD